MCFTESVSLRNIGKPTSRAEINSPSSLYFKAVKVAHLGSALTGLTSERSQTYYSLLRKNLELVYTLFTPKI